MIKVRSRQLAVRVSDS